MIQSTKIVFFGTPEFAVPALEALVAGGFDIAAVVTQPDKPVGRGLKMEAPAVKVKAQELGLTVLQPNTLKGVVAGLQPAHSKERRLKPAATVDQLQSLHAEAAVCVAYGKIIPKAVLDIFPRGILNVHPSLLPKYRGPSPIQAAILNGDTETGVTIILLDEEMDHGAILAQHVLSIAPSPSPLSQGEGAPTAVGAGEGPTGSKLSKMLAHDGARLLVQILPKYLSGKITPQEQDHARATFTKLLKREDGRIDWNKSAEYIERMVRAYDLWPGTWTQWKDKRIKILRVSLLHPVIGCASNSAPGYVWKTDDGRLAVNCNPGSVILEQLQLEGKKSLTVLEFIRGYPKFIGSVLN